MLNSFTRSRPLPLLVVGFAFSVAAFVAPHLAIADTAPLVLSTNYRLGESAPQIRLIQQFLNADGFAVASSGPGSRGDETTFFGLLTYRALKNFQANEGLPPTGYLGPLTRAAIALRTMSNATATPETATSTAAIASSIPASTSSAPTFAFGVAQPNPLPVGYTPGYGGGGGSSGAPSATPAAPVISSIAPSAVSDVSATITWTTDEPSTSLVEYGPTSSYGLSSGTTTLATSHAITLTGLSADTAYHFEVQSANASGALSRSGDNSFETAYLGYVATRGYIDVGDNTTDKQLMSRTFHYARSNITSLQLVLPDWWINGSAASEQLMAKSATTTASIEYPVGTFTQVTFGGSATGTIPAGGTLVSDPVSVTIPSGAEFYVRVFFENASGIVYSGKGDPSFGDATTIGTSTVQDQTMGGTVANNAGSEMYAPAAIIGTTTEPSVFIVGDSRIYGNDDPSDDTSGDAGEVARAIGPNFAYVNAGASGLRTDFLVNFLNADEPSDANMYKLASYASDIINETGVVDVILGSTTPQIENNLATLWSLFPPGIPVYQTTMPPYTTSTDGWTTLVNQTPNSDDAARIATDDWIRTTPLGLAGYFEVANLMESAQDSGLWKVPGYTTDGVHETTTGNIDIETSGLFATSTITR
ncbi:MAG TPA: peptidoglycan-binding protein [Xanthobacteraceae bacterium]|nr:peptidoglycan-binding protein [Xanthobacteraceae bacterium]